MIKKIPKGVPPVGVVVTGSLLLKIGEFQRDATTQDGRSMPKVQLTIEEPTSHKGLVMFEQFCLGTEDDPEADEPETWKKAYGCRDLCSMATAAGVESEGVGPDELLDNLEGQTVGAFYTKFTEPEKVTRGENKGEDNPYAGQEKAKRQRWLIPGEFEPEVDEAGDSKKKSAKAVAKAALTKKAKARDDDEDDAEDDDEPAPKKKVKKVEKVVVKKKKVVEEEEEEEVEEADEDEEEAPAPKAKKKAKDEDEEEEEEEEADDEDEEDEDEKPKKKVKKAADAKGDVLIKCSLCTKKIKRSEIDAHLESDHADD